MLYNTIDSLMANIKNGRLPLTLTIIFGSLNVYVRYLLMSCLIAGSLTYILWRLLTKGEK